MKKNVFYLLLAILGLTILPSCSKEEDDNKGGGIEETDYALQIAKTYDGALSIEGVDTIASTIVITRTEENIVKLTLKQFTYLGLSLGDIVVDSIAVTKSGSAILLSVEKKMVTVTALNQSATAPVTIKGNFSNDSLELSIDIEEIPVIGDIQAHFTTDKSILPPPVPPADGGDIWTALDGTYNGTSTITVVGTLEAPSTVAIEKKGEWKIQLTILNGVPMAPFSFPDIIVTENTDGTCVFSGSISNDMYSAEITGSADELGKIEFSGTISVAAMMETVGIVKISYIGSKEN